MVPIPGRKGWVPNSFALGKILFSVTNQPVFHIIFCTFTVETIYLCKSREEGMNLTHSLLQKVSSIQDFRDWNDKRKCLLTVRTQILEQLSSIFSALLPNPSSSKTHCSLKNVISDLFSEAHFITMPAAAWLLDPQEAICRNLNCTLLNTQTMWQIAVSLWFSFMQVFSPWLPWSFRVCPASVFSFPSRFNNGPTTRALLVGNIHTSPSWD